MRGVLLFVVGFALGFLWFSVVLLPLFYGLPRSIYGILKGQLRKPAVTTYILGPVIWSIVFVFAAVVVDRFFPGVVAENSVLYGQWAGILLLLIRCFTKDGRRDLREDFSSKVAHHAINTKAAC
jgi:hypothetical protein